MKILNSLKNYYKKNSLINTILKIYDFLVNILLINIKIFYLYITPIKQNKNKHELPARLIVSLTSYPARFKTLHIVLKTLFLQSVKPDKIILWIANNDKNKITKNITYYEKFGLKIKFCEDFKSFNKIIHTINENKDCYIITVDDDIIYHKKLIEDLINKSKKFPDTIIANRVHKIILDNNNLPIQYNNWEYEISNQDIHKLNFQTGVGGVLYPPGSFYKDVNRIDLINKLCPDADDIWLYWMIRLNKKMVKQSGYKNKLKEIPNTQNNNLKIKNVLLNSNDQQIKKMINYFGFQN